MTDPSTGHEPRSPVTTVSELDGMAVAVGPGIAVDQSRVLLELSREVTSTLELQEVLDRTFAALHRLVSFDGGAIQLIEDDHLVAVATDPPMSPEAKTVRIPVGQGVSGSIAATGEPVYIADITVDERVHPAGRKKGVSGGVRSYFGWPLIQHGEPIGVVQIDSHDVDAFTPIARATALAFAPAVAAAVQNATVFARERQALEQVEENLRLRRDFLAMVSHELRTPLASVTGFADILRQRTDQIDPDTVQDFARRIWRAGKRLERVMGDLLDLSNMERGSMTVTRRPTDLAAIATDAAEEQDSDEHPIHVVAQDGLPAVDTDPERLHQILGNLLSNARKFSPTGRPVTVDVTRDDGHAVVHVRDEGPGIAPEHRERVFEPFVQVEDTTTRRTDGLGVGLFIVRQLCDRLDIDLTLDSAVGRGTTFSLRIPIAAP